MHVVVIGGSDAGISAALRARELRPDVEVTVIVADAFPNYSVCGLPFFVSGETPDWHQLAHRTLDELEQAGLNLLLEHTATGIDVERRKVSIASPDGRMVVVAYDRLVIATGAAPIQPSMPGLDLPGVYPLHTMDDSFRVYKHLDSGNVREAAIVGSGYIGLEMADALTHRGVRVTLFGRAQTVLPTVDPTFGLAVAGELRRHGVQVLEGVAVEAIERAGDRLSVRGTGRAPATVDLVVVAAGVHPNSELAAAAGVATGLNDALRVDRHMATNIPEVYAAGDCVETWHRVLGKFTYLPLGTTSHKQGRVAGESAVGGERVHAGGQGVRPRHRSHGTPRS